MIPTIQIVFVGEISIRERGRLRCSERFPNLLGGKAELGKYGVGHSVIVSLEEFFAGN